MLPRRSLRVAPFLIFPLCAFACGGPDKPADVPKPAASNATKDTSWTDAPDGPVPSLPTTSLTMTEYAPVIRGQVLRTSIDGKMETLKISVDWPASAPHVMASFARVGSVRTQGSTAFAFVDRSGGQAHLEKPTFAIWARRAASEGGMPIALDLYVPSADDTAGGIHVHIKADDTTPPEIGTTILNDWESALKDKLSDRFASNRNGVWNTFAQARLTSLIEATKPPPKKIPAPASTTKTAQKGLKTTQPQNTRPASARPQAPPPVRSQATNALSQMMETSTGALAIQEALQADRPLFLAAAKEKQTTPIAKLAGPELAAHAWDKMQSKLALTTAPREPLAEIAPAEFYYVRAASFDAFTALLDQADAWGTAAAQAVEHEPYEYGLAKRYEAELGVERGPLSRALGSKVVTELAAVGSDPYFREGTDLTVIFRVKDHALFGASMSAALANHARVHGAIQNSQLTLAGISVSVARSADGTVRQHRATIGDLEFVSNSPGALTRVLEATQKKRATLADEPDFKFMLARDASTPSDVLAYMGDKFVAEVVGPKQKILEARRQLALGELMTPGFSALLYGAMFGKSPASADDMIAAKIFDKRELAHVSGEAIAWKPGETARSSWGTPAELTPLIDLPAIESVTESERASYERFAQGYQYDWGTYIDPVALRLVAKPSGDHTDITVDVRELPLLEGSHYDRIEDEAGATKFESGPLESGARMVLAIGEHSLIRKLLGESRGILGEKVQFDWVGDFLTVGVLDRSDVAKTLLTFAHEFHLPQASNGDRPKDADAFAAIAKLPIYGEIAVKNPVGVTIALTALRAMAGEAAPGLVSWGEGATYRDVPIVKVSIDPKKAKGQFDVELEANVYYAITRGALVVALTDAAIRKAIDLRLDDKAPKPLADKSAKDRGFQFSLDSETEKGRAVWTSLAWLFEGELVWNRMNTPLAVAEALFRGAPEQANDAAAIHALAVAYFGVAPLTPDGAAFVNAAEGPTDPIRGNEFAPKWPAVPVPGSPVEALMRAISHARADLAFDDEGADEAGKNMKSLHAHVTTSVR